MRLSYLFLGVGLFGVAGCGDDGSNSSSTGTGTASTTQTTGLGDPACELNGGVCGCAGGCAQGWELAPQEWQSCPQPQDSAGGCSEECCVPIPGSGTSSGSSSATGSSSGGTSTSTGTTGGVCEKADHGGVARCPNVVGESFCSEGAQHVAQGDVVPWMHDPPHSGPHYPTWESWGVHTDAVPRGNWVHNLEHGGVVLLYDCPSGCDAELAILEQVVADRPNLRILLTPDPLLVDTAFAAVSWTWVLATDTPDLAELLCFVDQHEGHAPEDIP